MSLTYYLAEITHVLPGTLYMCSHIKIFGFGYLQIDDINHGWLVLNVWHYAQYILTVWLFNNNRFKDGIHPKHRFLSYLSQQLSPTRRSTFITTLSMQ